MRTGVEKKKEEGGEEERKKTSSFNRKTSSHNHNHVIITVFLMDAQAVNKYHINYKISRIYRPLYNLSNRRWVLDAKLKFMTKACKTSNLNVDVQPLLLETKLFNLKKSSSLRSGQTLPIMVEESRIHISIVYRHIQHRFYHLLHH